MVASTAVAVATGDFVEAFAAEGGEEAIGEGVAMEVDAAAAAEVVEDSIIRMAAAAAAGTVVAADIRTAAAERHT